MPTDKSVPAWKEQARGLLHDAILDAARATFAERGYEGATVDEIAARAEVSKGTIYNYVEGGKAGLFVAVLHAHFGDLEALATRHLAQAGGPFRDRYHAFVSDVMGYFREHGDLLRMHLREVPVLLVSAEGGEQAAQLRCQRDQIVGSIAQALADAVSRGEVRDIPVIPTAHVAFGTLMGHLYHASAPGDGASGCDVGDAEAARFLTDLLFDGLRADASSDDGRPFTSNACPL
ncbi:MAG TPA: TetR/AcrR family transcriptional regulator [Rubricoccaceae bacterium]|jgi:AcrR family transcriptional regulator